MSAGYCYRATVRHVACKRDAKAMLSVLSVRLSVTLVICVNAADRNRIILGSLVLTLACDKQTDTPPIATSRDNSQTGTAIIMYNDFTDCRC